MGQLEADEGTHISETQKLEGVICEVVVDGCDLLTDSWASQRKEANQEGNGHKDWSAVLRGPDVLGRAIMGAGESEAEGSM